MRFLEPTVSRLEAQRALAPRRWRERLRHWMASPAPRRSHLEIVWLPRYRLTFSVRLASCPDAREPLSILADAYSGEVSPYPPNATVSRDSNGERFAPMLEVKDAESSARRQLTAAALRAAGWGRRAELGPLGAAEVVHYPMWVYYYERWRGRLDCRLLDGLTGRPVGAKAREALLAALGQKAKTNAARVGEAAPPRSASGQRSEF